VTVVPEALQAFQQQRPRLFAIAYRMLGSASEAEDAVQDTFLRWHAADLETIQSPAAWLTKVLTNLCLSRLTSARARRETYHGPWLPEPVLTAQSALGPHDRVEQRESVSLAFLLLLERLTPPQRAVFVLREAFDYSAGELAGR
jgi:RNA polymerase sigma-70 factor (ECF subfamily)